MSVNNSFVKVIGWKEHSGVRVAFGYIVALKAHANNPMSFRYLELSL